MAQRVIGHVRKGEDKVLRGKVATAKFALAFWIERNPRHDEDNRNSPGFLAIAAAPDGSPVQVGALWKRTANKTGLTFYNIQLDDPCMDAPLNATMFPVEQDEPNAPPAWDIVWQRERQAKAKAAGEDAGDAGEPAGATSGAPLDDEIPF